MSEPEHRVYLVDVLYDGPHPRTPRAVVAVSEQDARNIVHDEVPGFRGTIFSVADAPPEIADDVLAQFHEEQRVRALVAQAAEEASSA